MPATNADAYTPPALDPGWLLAATPDWLVVNKPAGLLSVPGRGAGKDDCAISRVQAQFADALIVHRLDMATSGLLLLARGPQMQRALSAAFRERQVDKTYLAIVAGRLADPHGSIDLPLITGWPNRPRQMVEHQTGKPSLTHYCCLGYDPARDVSQVALTPVTGRSHQLRVHMAALGHPILGDELYGGPHRQRASRLLLHAARLALPDPAGGAALHFDCPPDFTPPWHVSRPE